MFARLKAKMRSLPGYSWRGRIFSFTRNGNVGLIEFQRHHRDSTKDRGLFTINLGVRSQLLYEYQLLLGNWMPRDKPESCDCHYCERVGFLLPEKRDKWWSIDALTNTEDLADELFLIVRETVHPTLEEFVSDEALRDLWLSGQLRGNFGKSMVNVFLTVLLHRYGPRKLIEPTMQAIRDSLESGNRTADVQREYLQGLLRDVGRVETVGPASQNGLLLTNPLERHLEVFPQYVAANPEVAENRGRR